MRVCHCIHFFLGRVHLLIYLYMFWFQVDLRNDISGFLSSHPQVPLMSLHHFDVVNPIFPAKNSSESAVHLMKAANFDQSRIMQQTICYNKKTNWSVSISWGYSAHIYEKIIPRSILKKPIKTFWPWRRESTRPHYMFNLRPESQDPCDAPNVFYLDNVKQTSLKSEIVTSYVRAEPPRLSSCSSGKNSADHITKIQVFSPATKYIEVSDLLIEKSFLSIFIYSWYKDFIYDIICYSYHYFTTSGRETCICISKTSSDSYFFPKKIA